MSLGKDLRTWLLADAAITALVGTRCEQNKANQDSIMPCIWYGRSTTENEDALDDAAGTAAFQEDFDFECISDDIDEAEDLAKLLKAKHLTRGAIGSGTVQGVFVSDHADDYVPRGNNSDDGRHVAALQFQIMGYVPGA